MGKKIEPITQAEGLLEHFKCVAEAAYVSANGSGEPTQGDARCVAEAFISLEQEGRSDALAWMSHEMVHGLEKEETIPRARCFMELVKAVNEMPWTRVRIVREPATKSDGPEAKLFAAVRRASQLALLIQDATNDLSVKPGDTDEAWDRFSSLVSDLVDVRNGMRDVHHTQGGALDDSSVS